MTELEEQLAHRRRCRRRWMLNALTGWNLMAPPPTLLLRAPASGQAAPPQTAGRTWHESAGAIHVHTLYSDGMGTFEDVAAEASRCGLDFMLTSDHRTLAPLREGKEGYYGNCLALTGVELTCEGAYILGFRLPPEFEPREGEPTEVLTAIREAGGLGFLSLICDPRFAWRKLPQDGYVGVEVINMGSQGIRSLNVPNILLALARSRTTGWVHALSILCRRPAQELQAWDRLTQVRPIVGIGSVDAHARLKIRRRRVPIPAYGDSFRLLRTHVLCDERATGDARHDAALIYEAIEAGRCFFAYHAYGDATGFRFRAASAAGEATMGEEIPLGSGVRLTASHPARDAIFRLFHDGTPTTTVRGRGLDVTLREPGVYRVEVLRWSARAGSLCAGLKPWIYSNPIYVRP